MDYITRSEFEHYIEEQNQLKEEVKQLRQWKEQRQTEEMKAINVNIGSQDVLDRLDQLDEKLDRIDKKQDQHATGLKLHSTNIGALQTSLNKMATKDDLKAMATKQDLTTLKAAQDAHFDQIEAEQKQQHEMLRQILRLLGQRPGEGQP